MQELCTTPRSGVSGLCRKCEHLSIIGYKYFGYTTILQENFMANGYLQDVGFIDFYEKPIVTAYSDEVGYIVPMKHIIEDHLGLNWEKQRERMNSSRLYNPVVVRGYDINAGLGTSLDLTYPIEDIPIFASNASYVCLPINELNLFLCQINLANVKAERQETVYQYQLECSQVLHNYWLRGAAINDRKDPSRISSDRHDFCPRQHSHEALTKACKRYSIFVERTFDTRIDPEQILHYCDQEIASILDLDSDTLGESESIVVYLISFMERAAFDILFMLIEKAVPPDNLSDDLRRNIMNAWEGMGTSILAVQSPYAVFPGVGNGIKRELI